MIFSLLAKSRARSKGILDVISKSRRGHGSLGQQYVPNAFQMHGPDLDHVPSLLRLQNAITSASSHPSNVEELCSIDEVVI